MSREVQVRFYESLWVRFPWATRLEYFKTWLGGSSRALEMGIGTGRLAFTLAPLVSHYVGIDNSSCMLNILNEKLKHHSEIHLDVREMSMDSFELPWSFDRILMPFRFLQYAKSYEQALATLKHAANHLAVKGRVLIVIYSIGPKFYDRWHEKTYRQWFKISEHETLLKQDYMVIDLNKQCMFRTVSFYRNDIFIGRHEENLLWWNPGELQKMCELAGLKVTSIGEAFSLKSYSGEGEFLLEATLE